MRKHEQKEEEKEQKKPVKLNLADLRKRPYGLCAKAGISTYGMSPREAWAEWNEYRKQERTQKKDGKKQKKLLWKQSALHTPPQKIKQPTAAKTAIKSEAKKDKPIQNGGIPIPELNAGKISMANSNSMFDRGTSSDRSYKAYANEILSWDIPDSKKRQLLDELHKRWEKKLTYEAQHVPWTVSGPARYNARKFDKSEQVMRSSAEVVDWFKGVEESVKQSKSQYADTRKEKAAKAEDWFNLRLERGMFRKSYGSDELNPTMVAGALAEIAPHDPQRFIELYEKYDRELHFRKGTNADKLYQAAKAGTLKGAEPPKKLHESDNLNAYRGKLRSGEERVFMKFTTRPKRQMVVALKSRGWHWNATEGAWSVPVRKYDEEFVKGIDERYAKYL